MCLFCEIATGEVKSYNIYEDEKTVAFLDIAPVNYGHILVIPKKHYKNIEEIIEEDLCAVIKTVKKVGRAMKDNFGAEGYSVMENNDPVAGQVVSHVHFHVIPRKDGDGLSLWPQGKYGDGEAEEVMEKFKIN